MAEASIISIVSVLASSVVALAGIIVPQLISARERHAEQTRLQQDWWRDKRSALYPELLDFCKRATDDGMPPIDLSDVSVTKIEGRAMALSSHYVSVQFQSFMSAIRAGRPDEAAEAFSNLRKRLPEELWRLSMGPN